MKSIIGWNIQILDEFQQMPEVKIIDAVPGMYKIVFITCRTWEEAVEIKTRIEQEARNDTES